MKIGNRKIGLTNEPLVVAEMSGNHNQSLERALEITEAAAKSGVQALKLQCYTADTMTLDVSEGDFFIDDENIALVRVYSETVVVDYQRRKVDQVTKLFGLQKTAITEC